MGLASSRQDPQVATSAVSVPNIKRSTRFPKERGRYGVVNVKITSLAYATRRQPENETTVTVTPKGAVFFGSSTSPTLIQRAILGCGIPMLPPVEVPINDSRAHKLLVIHTDGWYAVPSPEAFSRHSGTCLILGDKRYTNGPYKIKLGDCFRLGSVGVVVSEVKTEHDAVEQRLDAKQLQYLKDEALAFDSEDEVAALAAEEEVQWRRTTALAASDVMKPPIIMIPEEEDGNMDASPHFDREATQRLGQLNIPPTTIHRPDTPSSVMSSKTSMSPDHKEKGSEAFNYSRNNFVTPDPSSGSGAAPYGSGGITNGERFVCYMCYETHDTPADPLVAPCECKGDTRYLHVQCLQKWYQSSVAGPQARVIRTTGTGAPACKICGTAYKTTFKRPDGRRANLLETECPGPYISLVVVTRHDTNPGLFNTKFRLNFGRLSNGADPLSDLGFANNLLIGRSSTCNMVLDYRTVSTVHAKISYEEGAFYIQDRESSNGTMVYLQSPLPLKFSTPVRIRMGRTTMQLQAKRPWTAAIRSVISHRLPFVRSSSSEVISNQEESPSAIRRASADWTAIRGNSSPMYRWLTSDELRLIMAETTGNSPLNVTSGEGITHANSPAGSPRRTSPQPSFGDSTPSQLLNIDHLTDDEVAALIQQSSPTHHERLSSRRSSRARSSSQHSPNSARVRSSPSVPDIFSGAEAIVPVSGSPSSLSPAHPHSPVQESVACDGIAPSSIFINPEGEEQSTSEVIRGGGAVSVPPAAIFVSQSSMSRTNSNGSLHQNRRSSRIESASPSS